MFISCLKVMSILWLGQYPQSKQSYRTINSCRQTQTLLIPPNQI